MGNPGDKVGNREAMAKEKERNLGRKARESEQGKETGKEQGRGQRKRASNGSRARAERQRRNFNREETRKEEQGWRGRQRADKAER